MLSMLSLSKFENIHTSASAQTFNMLHQLGVATIVRMVPEAQMIELEAVEPINDKRSQGPNLESNRFSR